MQLSFNFPFQEKYLPEDFVVSPCNKAAFEFVKNYDSSNEILPKNFAIRAPKLAGKSYLAHIWCKKVGAEFLNLADLKNINLIKFIKAKKFYIIEDIDEFKNQELLLQVFNLIQEKLGYLMLTSTVNLSQVGLKIKDLNSRLRNVFQLEITSPDDDLIKMLLTRNFAAKQLKVEGRVINFLTQNLHRDFASIFDIARLLEFYSLEEKRNITIALAKEILKRC